VLEEAAKKYNVALDKSVTVIQGFGNAGSVTANCMEEIGSRVVAVSDSRGGIYNPNGLDLHAVEAHKARTGSVVDFREADPVSNQDILELQCDVLVPAALEGQIHAGNADRIKARLIAEAANGPTSPEADAILHDKGIVVLPDILANAGGVTVSYFEWVQALQAFPWTADQVNERLREIMQRSFHNVVGMSEKHQVPLRTGALGWAINRVAEISRLRGVYP
jgi:glutamate dehydrogenase (NAD(P)+)